MASHKNHIKTMPKKPMMPNMPSKTLPTQASATAKARAFGQQGAAKRAPKAKGGGRR